MTTTSPDTLTPKQRRFVTEYLVDLNGTQAAVQAGYSRSGAHVTASKLLRNPKVALEVRRQQSLMQKKVDINRETVVNGLYEIASNPDANDGARVNAWAHIGKIIGAYVEMTEHVGTFHHLALQFQDISTEELRSFIAAGESLSQETEEAAIEGEVRVLGDGEPDSVHE